MASHDSVARSLVMFVAIVLAIAVGAFLIIILGRRSKEKFSAENFASTVVAQNPKVFERLAEM